MLTEKGYHAEAPYSGTEYDLLTDRMTVYTDAKRIQRKKQLHGAQKSNAIYTELINAAEGLLALVKKRKGCSNKDNAKLTTQIMNLIHRWE